MVGKYAGDPNLEVFFLLSLLLRAGTHLGGQGNILVAISARL